MQFLSRATDGVRTRDPDLGKVVLHQLSHSRIFVRIGVTGFEPATSWSQTRRSSQAEPHPVITVYINISQMILNFKYFYVPSKPHIEFRLFTNLFPLTFWISPRPISISQLRTLLHFHL